MLTIDASDARPILGARVLRTWKSTLSRHAATLAIAALGIVAAWPMQINGWNQNAHWALVRAVADGTPTIDRSRFEIGDLGTGDVTTSNGHVYSNKAPGLAFASVPPFLVLDAAGMRTTGDPTRIVWALHTAVLVPAFVLVLLLVRRLGDWLAPGYGAAAAVTAGTATLLLPFATLYFSHVLAAALCVAAFAVLWAERRGRPRLALVAAAGALSGLAVAVEYPPAIPGAILGLYAIARARLVVRGATYAAGVVAGLLPLLAYNWWAFGSPLRVSYEDNQVEPLGGFFGMGVPRLSALEDLLFSSWGLLANTPVVACGVVGAALLLRSRRRAEAAVLLAVPLVHLLYNASLKFSVFGGQGLPRYVIYTLPFVAIGLAPAYRALPLTTLALAIVSAVPMVVMTVTNPLAAYDGEWLDRLGDRDVSQTAAAFVNVTGWYTILLVFALVGLAVLLAARATPRPALGVGDAFAALCALAVWALIAVGGENPNGREFRTQYVVAVGLAAAAAVLVILLPFRHPRPARTA